MALNQYDHQVRRLEAEIRRLEAARNTLISTRDTVTAARDTFREVQRRALDGHLVQHIQRPRAFEGRSANAWSREYRDARIAIDTRTREAAGFINALQPQINRINASISNRQALRNTAAANAQNQRNSGG